jgi:flagellar basal-body rod modification protein FlgD
MSITPAAASAASPTASGTESSSGTSSLLGQNDFLKLMIAQLQAQNPLEPGNSNEFLNELAQITQVEQTTNLASSQQLSSAVQLIGHKATYNSPSGEVVTGTVQSAQSNAGGVTVTIEGVSEIKLTSITAVE